MYHLMVSRRLHADDFQTDLSSRLQWSSDLNYAHAAPTHSPAIDGHRKTFLWLIRQHTQAHPGFFQHIAAPAAATLDKIQKLLMCAKYHSDGHCVQVGNSSIHRDLISQQSM